MKKLLSFFLIIIMVVSSMQLSIIAEEADAYVPSPDAYKGQALLNSIGIETVYDNYAEDASRGEVLSLIMQLMNTKDYSTDMSPFLDISASEPLAAYAQTALSLGIISPAESFAPSKSILMAEAAKMGVVALGYANEAILSGGYPTGYLTCAQRLGLFDYMAEPQSETMSVGDMYVFLKNMSETDIRIQTSYGDDSQYTTTKGENIITYYHKLYEINGVISANQYTSLYDPDIKADPGCITINSKQYKYTGELMLGENIKAYVSDTAGTDAIVYAFSQDTEILCINGQSINQTDVNSVNITTENGKESTIRTVSRPVIIYNGQASANIAELKNEHLKNSEITFISNDGDKTYDIISIMQSSSFIVDGINVQLSKLYGKNGIGTLTLDDTNKDFVVYVNGVISELSKIKKDTVADVYTSENGSLVTIKVSSDTVSGEITAYAVNEKYVYIDDVKYEYTDYFETYYKNNANVGKEITALLNSAGLIVGTEAFSGSSLKYGYFLQTGKDQGLDSKVYARIFTAEGKYEIFTLADKITVDSIKGITPEEVCSTYLTGEQLMRYGLSSDKKLNKIDTCYSLDDRTNGSTSATTGFVPAGADDSDKLTRYSFPGEDGESTVYFKYNAMHPHFSLSGSSIIFVVDKSLSVSDEKKCMVTNRSSYENDQKFPANTVRPFNVSPNGSAEAMIEYSEVSVSLSGGGSKYGVVQSFNRAVTPDGDAAIKLVLFTNSRTVITAYLKNEALLESLYQSDVNKANGELPIGAGDIVRCVVNTSSEIEAITIDYDYSQKKVINKFTGTNVSRSDYQGYMYAFNSEDDIIFLANTKDSSKIEQADKIAVFTWGYACIFDSKRNMVYPATMSDIITYEKDPAACDFVYLRVNWAQGNLAVVYR